MPDECHFESKKGVLPEVHVHCVDASWTVQQVIQNIAAGAGDDHDIAIRAYPQKLAVDGGIFPAGVINQPVPVDESEELTVQTHQHRPPRKRILGEC